MEVGMSVASQNLTPDADDRVSNILKGIVTLTA